jgi:hypothetical protein
MKTLLVAAAANFSPAMANRFGPFDKPLTDDTDRLGQNGVSAAITTADGRHYQTPGKLFRIAVLGRARR